MSDVTTCRTCGLPRFHGPAGYAGAQCLCQWKGATLPQMYDELMAKNAALEAENARLRRAAQTNWNEFAEREAPRAQLAAIQGGMGEVAGFDRNAAYAACPESGCDWGSFYVGWKAAATQHQRITAAMAAEVERWKARCQYNADTAHDVAAERDALRAELAEVKESGWRNHSVNYARAEKCPQTLEAAQAAWDRDQELIEEQRAEIAKHKQTINQLRQRTPASPDVEGLVKALEDCAGRLRLLIDSRRHKMLDVVAEEKARAALSAWRQAHTPSTLPASSAEE